MPPCTKVHLLWQHYEMALPRSSALQKGRTHCPCDPFLATGEVVLETSYNFLWHEKKLHETARDNMGKPCTALLVVNFEVTLLTSLRDEFTT